MIRISGISVFPRKHYPVLLAVLLAGFLMGKLSWLENTVPSWSSLLHIAWTLPLWGIAGFLHSRKNPVLSFHPLHTAIFLLLLYLFMPASTAPDFFYIHWHGEGAWSFAGTWIERAFFFGALFFFILSFGRRWLNRILLAALIFLQISAFMALIQATGGAPLYRMDHPAFFFRLWSFAHTLPRFIYFDPFWNGGSVMPYLVASGVTGPGLFLWPVWKFIPLFQAYTPALGFLFIFLVPLLGALGAGIISRNRATWIAAALLSLGTSQFYFIHLVHYGTFGSLFATAFFMPAVACLYRLIVLKKESYLLWIVLFLSCFFLLCWPAAVSLAPPFLLTFAINIKRIRLRIAIGLLLCILGLALFHIFPALSLLSHSNIAGAVQTTGHPLTTDAFFRGCTVLARLLRQSNPILLFLGLLGVLLMPGKRMKLWFFPILLASLLFAAWGKEWKAILQFDRVWLSALFIAILPASMAFGYLTRRKDWFSLFATAFLCGLLVMGGYTAVKYMGNKGRAQFQVMPDEMQDITHWIKKNVPKDGRVLFAGVAGHNYGAAEVAALPIFCKREMMACDYYNFSSKLVEYGYPPKEFRKYGPDKLMLFFEMYNVTHIITVHENWKRFLRNNPAYKERKSWRQKTIFEIVRPSNMFLQGKGTTSATTNTITVHIDNPNKPVVIKYNYVKGLSCEPANATLSPYDTGTSIKLIRIQPNGASTVHISYKKWY